MKRLWKSLYAKVRGMAKGYVVGGGAAAAVTSILNAADTTDLSSTEKIAYSLGAAAVLGAINAYRTPETHPAGPDQVLAPTPTPPGPERGF